MYKLREARLKEFYVNEMDPKNQQSFDAKAPITSRHGDAMADHSFESLKSNEIHGTDMSDIKFGNTGGWNVITSSEVSDDGKARTDKTLAKTEGVTAIKGGQKAFSGKNEELKTERIDGDANNFTHTTGESTNMVLNENIVTGDDTNKRTESKSSSSSSHTTKVIRTSNNTGDFSDNMVGNDNFQSNSNDYDSRRSSTTSNVKSSSHVDTQKSNVNENVKLSQDPAVVQEAFRLAQQSGTVLSRKVERANESTNMITERKELTDGTIVTTKRFEPISSQHVDIQATTTSNNQRDNKTTNVNKHHTETTNQSRNTETSNTTTRDEEAFRLAQQPGNLISRDVTMTDANTRMITEKKELSDGTVVTTKRFERVSNDRSNDNARSEHVTKTSTTSNNQTFKTSRDEEAFKLAQQPGKIISRDVTMTNPTTRQIVEKKELNDGTIVTTKRFESVDSSNDTKTSTTSITKDRQNDDFTKSLRSDSKTTKVDTTHKTSRDEEAFRLADQPGKIISRDVTMTNPTTRQIVEKKELHDGTIVTTKRFENVDSTSDTRTNTSITKERQNDDFTKSLRSDTNTTKVDTTYRTPKDAEAFRLAEQPGKILSRDVTMANPTTRQIVEKKELHDGTIVTTKRFERIDENVDTQSRNVKNVENVQNVKTIHTTTQQARPRSDDYSTNREIVEETVTKKIIDTSCQCPTAKDKHDHKTRDFIQNERNTEKYDVTSEIIVQQNDKKVVNEFEKSRDEINRREEVRKLEQKRIDEQIKQQKDQKITRELEVDAAHRAFASSLRSVTPPPDRSSTTRIDRRSPSRETNSRYSSSTISTKRSSNVDIRKDDNTKHTNSLDRRTVTKSPEKYSSLDRRTPSKSPEKYPSIDRKTAPKNQEKVPTTERRNSSHSPEKYPSTSPDKQPQNKNITSVTETTTSESIHSTVRDRDDKPKTSSPQKPGSDKPDKPRTASSQKPSNDKPRTVSPQKPSHESPRNVSPTKPEVKKSTVTKTVTNESDEEIIISKKHQVTPELKPRESSPAKSSTSRATSPQKPIASQPNDKIRSSSPQKHNSAPTETYPRETSPVKSIPSNSRDVSPQKHQLGKSYPRDSSPAQSSPSNSRDPSPQKHHPTKSYPRETTPVKSSPSNSRENSPQKYQPSSTGTYPRESTPVKSSPSNSRGTSPQKQTTSLPRDLSPSKPVKRPDYEEQDTPEDILTATIKIDNIDKTINDLKIIQTIDSKNMSATTSVSDLEYISASDHRKMITDLDNEDIEININIENVDQLDDLQIKTTISEIVDEKATKTAPKGDKKPFNRSETFEERAKKLIGVKPDDEPKDIPNYLKPTKASQAPGRVSEIRERKAKIEEIEKSSVTTTNKRKSLTSATTDFIKHEKTEHARPSSPERSPTRKQQTESKKPKDRSNDVEITNTSSTITTKTTNLVHKRPEDKKPDTNTNIPDERKPSKVRDTVDITETTKVTERKGSRSPTRPKSPETHITTAQITISPSRGITSKLVTKTTTVQSNKNLKVAPHIKLLKQNTDVSSTEPESDRDTDHELIRNIDKPGNKSTKKKLLQNRKDTAPVTKTTSVHDKEKVTRTFSERIIKNDKKSTVEKSRETPKKESKRPVKCITTKTINLTNVNGGTTTLHSNTLDNVEIDINVQHAKSSREPSPNKVVPIPVQTDEEVNDEHILHPHKVTEPDDGRKIKPAIRNVPIYQEETNQFVGLEITEVGTEKGHTIIEEEEFEETERIINSSTLEKADRKRNSVQIDALSEDDEEEHSHLLSVSQKVNKFNETVDELKKPKTSSKFKKDNDYKLEDVPDDVDDDAKLSLNEKVSKFTKITDETTTVTKHKLEDTLTTSIDEVDENLKNDECLLSVSDKVNKFIASAEKIGTTTPQKSPELVKNIMKQTSKHVRDKIENINDSFLTNEKMSTLERDTKTNLKSSEITLKSTEAIKKAREVFETNSSKTREINRQNDILSRPSVFEGKRTPVPERKVYEKPVQEKPLHERTPDRQSPLKDTDAKPSSRRGSSDRTPIYMKDQVSTKKDLFEKRISSSKLDSETSYHKPLSQQSSIEEKQYTTSVTSEDVHQSTRKMSSSDKHYMQHTLASLEHVARAEIRESELSRTSKHEGYETRRDSTRSTSKQPSEPRDEIPESPRSPTKFGVELKKTDSFKTSTSTTSSIRKVSLGSETINIEEIFDLYELEKLLEIVVGYEQRRRIRAQIRIVKKKLEDSKTASEIKSSRMTTTKTTIRNEPVTRKQVTERKTSEKFKAPRDDDSRVKSSVVTTTTTTTRISSDKEPKVISKTTKVTSTASPRTIIETFNKNNKGKVTESVVKNVRKTSATSSTQKSSTMRETCSKTCCDETDCITSSYGVGPTENGVPLFGLKALKKKSPAVVESKTTGTVVSEVSYSENGGPAVVQRKTTKYSSDPSDFSGEAGVNVKSKSERKDSRGGIYSVSKVEKFESDKKSTPRVIRNGSVKEIKEKFVRKDSSSKMSRTESKRSSVDHHDSECCSVSKTVRSSQSSETKSFLNNDKKASSVKEVITYMRNADEVFDDGDTKEDAEAKALLNKYFGASALMTTIESSSGLSKGYLSTGGAKNKTKSSASKTTTKTVTSLGSTKAYDINDIWDVDLLKKLLDSATNYDDRRKIRERIRQVMADKEACAELVKNSSADLEVESNASSSGSNLHDKVESTIEEAMTKTSSEVQQQGDRIIKTTTTEVITKSTMQPQKKVSPFDKFRQLDRQNSLPNSPSPRTPSTPTTPGGSKNGPIFSFTDPTLAKKASTVKEQLLTWAQMKTKEYENVNIQNFSASWSDGLAFAALIHHFLPDAFDYSKLTPKERRHNFTLAFRVADEKAGIAPLLDVDDMVMYKKPDWKCVFCYVQSIYRRFKDEI
ncbi:unnamed protein product [Chironomus riparius]|uniref:Calponin-homology (CH) domain-containing protein n=1 Tax=Chironomus riparius TaxID=315576 RepID=A0A9P0IU43_9DIPT|nr:unnamed protein product [Chironomus riparius]